MQKEKKGWAPWEPAMRPETGLCRRRSVPRRKHLSAEELLLHSRTSLPPSHRLFTVIVRRKAARFQQDVHVSTWSNLCANWCESGSRDVTQPVYGCPNWGSGFRLTYAAWECDEDTVTCLNAWGESSALCLDQRRAAASRPSAHCGVATAWTWV